MSNDDRRSFICVENKLEVDAASASGLEFACRTEDISYHTLLLATDVHLPDGERLDVTVWLGEKGSGLGLRIHGVVAHATNNGIAVAIDDVAHRAFEYLRRLTLFSASDPDRADQQIMRDLGLSESA